MNCQVNFGLRLKGISFRISEEAHPLCSTESRVCGYVAHGHTSSLSASSSWCSPTSCPQPPSATPCREQELKQTGHLPDPFCPSGRVLVPPVVLTKLVCLYVCVYRYTCTFVHEWNIFVGSSFDIWFSIYIFGKFLTLFSLSLISYQSYLLLKCVQTLIFLVSFHPTHQLSVPFLFFSTIVSSIQQAFSECWAPARFWS